MYDKIETIVTVLFFVVAGICIYKNMKNKKNK